MHRSRGKQQVAGSNGLDYAQVDDSIVGDRLLDSTRWVWLANYAQDQGAAITDTAVGILFVFGCGLAGLRLTSVVGHRLLPEFSVS